MALISRCCCWKSVRKGSFASGIFTLSVYLVILVSSVFHVHSLVESIELLTLNIIFLIFSFLCVVSSVILLVGLCVDNRLLLLPWVASVSATTTVEFIASLYFIPDVIENPLLAILFVTDILFCILSVYSIMCVISQYQQYLCGRGRAGQSANCPAIPTVRFQASGCGAVSGLAPSVSNQVGNRRQNGLLTVPNSSSRATGGQTTDVSCVISSDERSSSSRRTDDTDDAAETTNNLVVVDRF